MVKTPPNTNNFNDFIFPWKKKTNNKKANRPERSQRHQIQRRNKKRKKKSRYAVSRYAVTRFTNNPCFCIFSPRLSEFSYILIAKNLHRNFQPNVAHALFITCSIKWLRIFGYGLLPLLDSLLSLPSKLRFLEFLPYVTSNKIYLSEKHFKKGPFFLQRLYVGKKYLRAIAYKCRESHDRKEGSREKSDFLLLRQKDPFGELFSDITL